MIADFLELKRALQSIESFRPNTSFLVEEERVDPFPFSKGSLKAEVVDSSVKHVSSLEPKKFSSVYFLDGVQRTVLLGESEGFPVFMHLSGAAVVKRSGKVLSPFGEPPSQVCLITHPSVRVDSRVRVEFVKDFESADMSAFTQRSSLLRKRLEQDLFKKAVKFVGAGEVMIFDGPLFYTEDLPRSNVFGVIKRHSVLYLSDHKTLNSLEAGERSPVFLLERGKEGAKLRVVSFYLRLFQRRDPFHGLVRVEVPRNLADTPEKLDGIASFIFSERFPLTLAAHQSDKKLYPISVCEKYLSSKLPSTDLLSAFLSDVMKSV
jgi:hypothetical protein